MCNTENYTCRLLNKNALAEDCRRSDCPLIPINFGNTSLRQIYSMSNLQLSQLEIENIQFKLIDENSQYD